VACRDAYDRCRVPPPRHLAVSFLLIEAHL
jgi:hypothetical protein